MENMEKRIEELERQIKELKNALNRVIDVNNLYRS